MIKNIISSFFARAGVALINLCILLIASRQMGSEVVGQISLLILNIAVIQSVVEIYSGSTLIYFIPKLNVVKVYVVGLLWIVFVALACNLLLLILGIVEYTFVHHVIILSILFSLHAFHLIVILGKEKIKHYNFLAVLQPIMLLIFLYQFVLVQGDKSFSAYLSALYFSIVPAFIVSGLTFWFGQKNKTSANESFQFKQILSNGFINQMANLSHTLSNRLNYYVLGASALVGVYANSTSLVESLWVISASISPLLLTHVANQRDEHNQGRLTLLLAKVCFLLSLVGVVTLYFLPASFFTYLLGKDFYDTKYVMLYLAPGVLCISFSSILSHYFSGRGMQRVQLSANLSGLIMAGLTSYILILKFGLIGACISASLSYCTQALVLIFIFMNKNKLRWIELIKFSFDKHLLN